MPGREYVLRKHKAKRDLSLLGLMEMKIISHVPVICCILAFAMLGPAYADIFPPQEGGYMGDHIVITTPGKYTLERDIHHNYPVGIVILSSSVIINGNNHTISPSAKEKENVGIWIAAYDQQGMPITGITLKDIYITGETYGIFIEGDNPAPFSWAADSKAQTGSTRQNLLTQMIDILSVTISACTTGIGIPDGSGIRISDAELRENEYGIIASGRDLIVKDSVITKNIKSGILLDGVIGTSLSKNLIAANAIGVEARNNSIDTLSETDNIYDTQQNIVIDRMDTPPTADVSFVFPLPIISPTISSDGPAYENADYPVEQGPAGVDARPMPQMTEANTLIMELQFPSPVPTSLPSVELPPTLEPTIPETSIHPMPVEQEVEQEQAEVDARPVIQMTEPNPFIMELQFPSPVPASLPSIEPSPTPEPQIPEPATPAMPVEQEPAGVDARPMAQMTEPNPLIMELQFPFPVPTSLPSVKPFPTPEPTNPAMPVEQEPAEVDAHMTQMTEPNPPIMELQFPPSLPTLLPSVEASPTPEIVPHAVPTPTQVPRQIATEAPMKLITGTYATIIGSTIPDTLVAGSKTSVSLVIANTGSVAWREDDGIGISAIGDTARYAPAWLNVPITKNEKKNEYTLDFTLVAPGTPGEYTFSFQAGKKRSDLTSTFGRPYTKTVLIT